MHPILRNSLFALEITTKEFQNGLKTMAEDHAAGVKHRQIASVMLLKDLSLRIDTALCALLADACCLGHGYWKGPNLGVLRSIHLGCLANRGLIDAIALMETSRISLLSHSAIRQLIITWCRFQKSAHCIRLALNHPAPRRKNLAWGVQQAIRRHRSIDMKTRIQKPTLASLFSVTIFSVAVTCSTWVGPAFPDNGVNEASGKASSSVDNFVAENITCGGNRVQ